MVTESFPYPTLLHVGARSGYHLVEGVAYHLFRNRVAGEVTLRRLSYRLGPNWPAGTVPAAPVRTNPAASGPPCQG